MDVFSCLGQRVGAARRSQPKRTEDNLPDGFPPAGPMDGFQKSHQIAFHVQPAVAVSVAELKVRIQQYLPEGRPIVEHDAGHRRLGRPADLLAVAEHKANRRRVHRPQDSMGDPPFDGPRPMAAAAAAGSVRSVESVIGGRCGAIGRLTSLGRPRPGELKIGRRHGNTSCQEMQTPNLRAPKRGNCISLRRKCKSPSAVARRSNHRRRKGNLNGLRSHSCRGRHPERGKGFPSTSRPGDPSLRSG